MDILKGSAAAACFLGMIFSILGNMVPSEKFSRQINIIFALIMALVIIPPFMGLQPEFPELFEENDSAPDTSDIINYRMNEEICGNICDSLADILGDKGIFPAEISVEINNSADGSISITKAEITLTDSTQEDNARRIVSEALGGAEVTVKIEGSES